jgi:hypothetical protein
LTGRAWPARVLGIALVLAAWDLPTLVRQSPLVLTVAVVSAVPAWWAAPPVVARPVREPGRLPVQLVRHRNTVLAVGAVLLAALTGPGVVSATAVTALLLGYLLLVDAAAAGPSGRRQLQEWVAPAAALLAGGLVLAAAFLPVAPAAFGPLLAALAVAASAGVIGLAVWVRGER